ncbi:MAG: hypothetical protein WA364_02785 [Candidatus Nitrosopolaris sp.]
MLKNETTEPFYMRGQNPTKYLPNIDRKRVLILSDPGICPVPFHILMALIPPIVV